MAPDGERHHRHPASVSVHLQFPVAVNSRMNNDAWAGVMNCLCAHERVILVNISRAAKQ